MHPADVAGFNALQSAFAYNPFGEPGYGPMFGPLPELAQLPPGSVNSSGGTFFGPQIYSPRHLSFGGGAFGQLAGFGIESAMAGRGYSYMPFGANPMDVWRAREQESDRYRFMSAGQSVDEHRLARAVEQGMKLAIGSVSPGTAATAGAIASANFMPFYSMGGFSAMPGGSATDFMANMWTATRNMGVQGPRGFQLGMPTEQAANMASRLLEVLTPGGNWDAHRMRNMSYGDMGALAAGMTSYGLLDTNVTKKDLTDWAGPAGVGSTQLADTTSVVQVTKVAKQLKSYADVIGTMKELMGDPNAPLDKIMSTLQQVTGNSFQQYNPERIQDMLLKFKELARAANMSMSTMMEIAKTGAQMAQASGMYSPLGAAIGATSAVQTVAAQTMLTGPVFGRMAPEEYGNMQQQWLTRGVTSPAARMSVQTLRVLEELNYSGLSAGQKSTVDALRQRATSFGLTEFDIGSVADQLSQLGISRTTATQRLFSNVGVQPYLADHSGLLSNLHGAQLEDVASKIGLNAQSYLSTEMAAGGAMSRALVRAAGSRGMDALAGAIGQSYINSPNGSVESRMEYLRSQGFNVSGLSATQLFGNLESSAQMQDILRASGNFANFNQFSIFAAKQKLAANQGLHAQADIGVEGQKILKGLNITARSSMVERIFGALGRGGSDPKDIMARALGFIPTSELADEITRAGGMNIAEAFSLYQSSGGKGPMAELYRKNLEKQVEAFAKVEQASGIDFLKNPTPGLSKFINSFSDTTKDALRILESRPNWDPKAVEPWINRVTGLFGGMSDDMIAKIEQEGGPQQGAAIASYLRAARGVSNRILGGQAATQADVELFAGANTALERAQMTARKSFRNRPINNIAQQVAIFNEMQQAREEFAKAQTPEQRKAAMSKLRTLAGRGEGSVITNGPDGMRLSDKFIADMVNNADMSDSQRAGYFEQLNSVSAGFTTDVQNALAGLDQEKLTLEHKRAYDIDEEKLSPEERMRRDRNRQGVHVRGQAVRTPGNYSDDEWAWVTGGKDAAMPKGVSSAKSKQMRGAKEAYTAFQSLRSTLASGDFQGKEAAVSWAAANPFLFEGGHITQALSDILSTQGFEGMTSTMTELAKWSGNHNGNLHDIVKKAMSMDSAGSDKKGGETSAGSLKVKFMQDGKALGSEVEIQVAKPAPPKNTGEEAAAAAGGQTGAV